MNYIMRGLVNGPSRMDSLYFNIPDMLWYLLMSLINLEYEEEEVKQNLWKCLEGSVACVAQILTYGPTDSTSAM